MIVFTLRTDKQEAEIGLYDDQKQVAHVTWQAHHQLAETIHQKTHDLLASQKLGLEEIQGIVVYKGPGSFTGLRIGLSVANALAYGLAVPTAATNGSSWIQKGIMRLESGQRDAIALPEYGAPVHTTLPKK